MVLAKYKAVYLQSETAWHGREGILGSYELNRGCGIVLESSAGVERVEGPNIISQHYSVHTLTWPHLSNSAILALE